MFSDNDTFYDDYGAYDYDDEHCFSMMFADPGGQSALRAASPTNPRIHPCPTCGAQDRLTPKDVALGYQCDDCAATDERGW
jgi:hypothetical protein